MAKAKIVFTLFILFLCNTVTAQQKRPLNHKDYDGWESISSEKITKDGQWVGFQVTPQEGDGRLEILSPDQKDRHVIPRADRWSFSHDNRYAIGRIQAQRDTVRSLKLKKTKAEYMPQDSLFILELQSGKMEKLAKVKSFKLPDENGNWLAIHFEKESPKQKDESDTTKVEKEKKGKKKPEGTKLVVRSFDGGQNWDFEQVKSYGFSEKGDYLYFAKSTDDTLATSSLHLLDLNSGETESIDIGQTDYLSPIFSKESKYIAYLSTEDSAKAKKPYYDLSLYDIGKKNKVKVAGQGSEEILPGGMVSKHGQLFFSKDESRLYFGTAPDYEAYPYEDDTTILDEERVNLDIWGWQDDDIQPMQLVNKSREEKKTYLASYNLKSKKIIQLGDEQLNDFRFDKHYEHKTILGYDASPYRRNYSWDIQIGKDLYLVNLETGARELIQKNVIGNPVLSPEGKYAYWYDSSDSTWMGYDLKSKALIDLTGSIGTNFYNELHDSPSFPGSYGSAGWLEGDQAFLVYDRYDIWKIDPTGKYEATNLTLGKGREQTIEFRRIKLDDEEEGIDPKGTLMLRAFHEWDKRSGYFNGDYEGKRAPQEIIFSHHNYFGLSKAKEADKLIVRRSTYQQSPDVFATDSEMKNLDQLSFSNPQQEEVNWGAVELVEYKANDGTPLQGLLFKPENFNEDTKYPMMVYFYERNSDGLHNYRAPVPSASIISIPYFVSNGYLVFVPDIKYELGLPGPSAFNSIIPGVQAVVAQGFVDEDNMAIQGQSWGGYQVAYLITQTNMFKAAGSGAPVVNMTSAYGGIRWGTGMSRMFQYEQTQSRIGGTLWDKPLYYIENSPLFFMDRVNTPVLIMHNDEDGSVPWYQGIEMFMALKRLNKPAWLLQYNGEDHNLKERKNRKDLSIRLSQFFDHYLKGAPAPLWMTEGLPAVEKGRTLKYELEQ
ncbi:MAG TPA: prolyl oligopeptidase family serine peptidase [Cyclobacteriaceae bacterium]|nr:prolyl oligopeptidase family serine peptidase [Cyclobacteriaceae bacterium]